MTQSAKYLKSQNFSSKSPTGSTALYLNQAMLIDQAHSVATPGYFFVKALQQFYISFSAHGTDF